MARQTFRRAGARLAGLMGGSRSAGPASLALAAALALGPVLMTARPAGAASPAPAGLAAPVTQAEGTNGYRVVDRIAAVVNGEVITLGQLERRLRLQDAPTILIGGPCPLDAEGEAQNEEEGAAAAQEEAGLQGPAGAGDPATSDETRRRVLQQLIDRLLVLQHVRRFPQPEVTAERVDEEMASLVACFGSPREFQEVLDRWGQTRAAVRRDLEQQLMVRSYLQGRFGAIVEIGDDEIRTFYEETLVPEMEQRGAEVPALEAVEPRIRQILEQQEINRRQEQWIADLRARAEITVYVW